ncbi:MAG: DUF4397 domain-containing protein [Eubacteriales bacterium]
MNIRMNYTTRQELNAQEEVANHNITYGTQAMESRMNMPVIPLPNVGEGGAVAPVVPELPTPEVTPNPERPPSTGMPTIPLPNVGEGGAVGVIPTPGNLSGIIATIITSYPRPNAPCNFCGTNDKNTGEVRFLNAACEYNAFRVYVNEQLFIQPFYYGEMSEYQKVASGYQMITISGENGYVYVQDSILIPEKGAVTIAIVNTATGIGLTAIQGTTCNSPSHVSCVRVSNLCHNSGDLDLVIGASYVAFNSVSFEETTDYKVIWPDNYYFYVSRKRNAQTPTNQDGMVLLSSQIAIKMNKQYTIYLVKWENATPNAVRAIIVEE